MIGPMSAGLPILDPISLAPPAGTGFAELLSPVDDAAGVSPATLVGSTPAETVPAVWASDVIIDPAIDPVVAAQLPALPVRIEPVTRDTAAIEQTPVAPAPAVDAALAKPVADDRPDEDDPPLALAPVAGPPLQSPPVVVVVQAAAANGSVTTSAATAVVARPGTTERAVATIAPDVPAAAVMQGPVATIPFVQAAPSSLLDEKHVGASNAVMVPRGNPIHQLPAGPTPSARNIDPVPDVVVAALPRVGPVPSPSTDRKAAVEGPELPLVSAAADLTPAAAAIDRSLVPAAVATFVSLPVPRAPEQQQPAAPVTPPSGPTKVEVRTSSLGPVAVEVSAVARDDDRLHVHFAVERAATAALLVGGDGLDRALAAAGSRLDSVSVDVRGDPAEARDSRAADAGRDTRDRPAAAPWSDPRPGSPRLPRLAAARVARDRFA